MSCTYRVWVSWQAICTCDGKSIKAIELRAPIRSKPGFISILIGRIVGLRWIPMSEALAFRIGQRN